MRLTRPALGLVALVFPSLCGVGCTAPEAPAEPAEALGTSVAAVTANEAIARAEQWVDAKLLYCQSPNHKSDAVDPACPAICNRTDNPAWDPYRSDCSGLISWAWGLPAPGRTTYGFAPFKTDITQLIPASELGAGDAVNNSHHVMLFKAWVNQGQSATFIEEPGCSSNPNYAHEFTAPVTLNGSSITVKGSVYSAIHYTLLGPSCMDQCTYFPRAGVAASPTGQGSWITDAAGTVYPVGNAGFHGDVAGAALAEPVVAVTATPSGAGYWLAASDGGVFSYGDAGFHGSAAGLPLNQPVVGMAPTPDGGGYWLVAGDGGVFSFGNAGFFGSPGGMPLNQPVVGMAPTPSGQGYWLVASDGGIFAYGDAGFFGSLGGMPINQPVVGMAPTPSGQGYWLVAADGGIFTYGDAGFFGSLGGMPINQPVVGMARTPTGQGYWLVAADGGVFAEGDAAYLGNALGSTCQGNTPRQCAVAANGCYAWKDAPACAAGEACAHGTCQATCSDACVWGATQCGGDAVEHCGAYGSAPCAVWSSPVSCPDGQSCKAGVCSSPSCTDECAPGATSCKDGALLACTGTSESGCHTWGAPTPCMAGQVCKDGLCANGAGGSGGGGLGGASGTGGPTTTSGAGGGSAGESGGCALGRSGEGDPRALVATLALLALARRRPSPRGRRRAPS